MVGSKSGIGASTLGGDPFFPIFNKLRDAKRACYKYDGLKPVYIDNEDVLTRLTDLVPSHYLIGLFYEGSFVKFDRKEI